MALAGSSVDWSTIPIHQGGGLHPWSGHIQEATNERINKWDNRVDISLSLSSLCMSQINFFFSEKQLTVITYRQCAPEGVAWGTGKTRGAVACLGGRAAPDRGCGSDLQEGTVSHVVKHSLVIKTSPTRELD